VYYVTFKSYGTTEALRTHDLKPMSHDSKKWKADGSTVAAPTPAPPNVISAAADINPALASAARKEPAKASDGAKPSKVARKVKANKELEAGKSKWQTFTTKGKVGKASKKESMFRTGDSVTARGWSLPVSQIATDVPQLVLRARARL
jgi:survival-of-motor-neuron-related-splicing factor 30